jgi:hypothetical protein
MTVVDYFFAVWQTIGQFAPFFAVLILVTFILLGLFVGLLVLFYG